MLQFLKRHTFCLLVIIFATLTTNISTTLAQSGSFSSQTLTFADNATAKLTITVGGGQTLLPPTTTRIRLQFISDDNNTPLPASAVSNVSFVLGNGSQSLSFTIAASIGLDDSTTFPNKRIQFVAPDAAKLLYEVDVTHNTLISSTTTETWTLALSGLPTTGTSPTLRVIASIDQGFFASLTPVGLCVAKHPCPAGQQCCGGNGDATNCTGQCNSACGTPCATGLQCCGGNSDSANCTGSCKLSCAPPPPPQPRKCIPPNHCCAVDDQGNCTLCAQPTNKCLPQ